MSHCYRRLDALAILSSRAAVSGDFDGDSLTDLVVTCETESSPLGMCFIPLNGSGEVQSVGLNWSPGPLPVLDNADFNADGKADVLVSSFNKFAVFSIDHMGFHLLNEFSGADVPDPADSYLYPAIAIDIDQDGAAEVITGSGFNGLQVWHFDENANAWSSVGDRLPLFGCGDLADGRVADIDGDTVPELVAIGSHNNCDANLQPGSAWNRVSVFTPNGLELIPAGDFAAEIAASHIEVADFDGDSIQDLLVASEEDMMMFRGIGNRTFLPPVPVMGLARFVGTGPRAADFNMDGFSEALVPQEDASYRILVGLPSPEIVVTPDFIHTVLLLADLDDDGRPDIVSLAEGPSLKYHPVLTLSRMI